MNRFAAILAVAISSYQPAYTQQNEAKDSLMEYFHFNDSPPLNCLFTYFPSFFLQHGIELKEFIRSRTFRDIRHGFGDAKAVDAIYIRAMQMTDNNTAISLWISTIACFDHRVVGFKVPLFSLFFPLTDESEEEFARRVRHLPSALYDDSPKTPSGDRDKLQHFFGSAFVTFVFESRDAAMRIGEFVEKGEDAFIIDGVNDSRDLRADTQGQQFGLALFESNRRLPSDFLTSQIASHSGSVGTGSTPCCAGGW